MNNYQKSGTERYGEPKHVKPPEYGKIIREDVYFKGQNVKGDKWWEEHIEITDRGQLFNEVMDVLDLTLNNTSHEVTITLKRNRDGQLKLVKRHLVR